MHSTETGHAQAAPRLDGQVAIVTGAGQGIGRACALHLAGLGAKVLVNSRLSSGQEPGQGRAAQVTAEILAAGGQARFSTVDAAEPEAGQRLVEEAMRAWGRIDMVHANAALGQHGRPAGERAPDGLQLAHTRGQFVLEEHAAEERAEEALQQHIAETFLTQRFERAAGVGVARQSRGLQTQSCHAQLVTRAADRVCETAQTICRPQQRIRHALEATVHAHQRAGIERLQAQRLVIELRAGCRVGCQQHLKAAIKLKPIDAIGRHSSTDAA